MKKSKCFDAPNGQTDTAGNPVIIRVCYCGTTGCTKLPNNDYPLPADFPNELSKEEEERFYKKVFGK